MKLYIETLGCPKNFNDSEGIRGIWEKAGMHLLCIEYTSDQPSLLQLTVGINIGGKSAASVTVNGTEGENKTVYRDISLITGNTKVSVNYPEDLINVTKLEIKG